MAAVPMPMIGGRGGMEADGRPLQNGKESARAQGMKRSLPHEDCLTHSLPTSCLSCPCIAYSLRTRRGSGTLEGWPTPDSKLGAASRLPGSQKNS